jgi:putative membrane protein
MGVGTRSLGVDRELPRGAAIPEDSIMRVLASILAVTLTLIAFSALPDDSSFIRTLAEGGRVEVEAGELAANKGVSNDVRKFGLMMAKDHGAANQKIATIAKAKGIALPTAFSAEKTEMLNRLRSQEGARFDQEYLAHMVAGHEKTLELLKSEISGGGSSDTKALAQELLPTVQSHLREAYRLTGQHEKAAALPSAGH